MRYYIVHTIHTIYPVVVPIVYITCIHTYVLLLIVEWGGWMGGGRYF